MQKASEEPSGPTARETHRRQQRRSEGRRGEHTSVKEAVEKAASAYFSACRKLARAINHLKK